MSSYRLSAEERERILRSGDPELMRMLFRYYKLRRRSTVFLMAALFWLGMAVWFAVGAFLLK